MVPCRFDPVVFECVASIRAHHPDDRVVVVDSYSPDPSYLDALDADVVFKRNRDYMTGAYRMALDTLTSDRWAFIHDSLIVESPVDQFDTAVVRTIDGFIPQDQRPYADQQLARMGLAEPASYLGVFGTMLFAPDDVVQQIRQLGFFDVDIPTKVAASATERTLGVALAHLGIEPVSIQGHHSDPWAVHDNTFVRKQFRDRP